MREMSVPTNIGLPKEIYAGDTVKFTLNLPDYPASSYDLTVRILSVSVEAEEDGDGYSVTIPAKKTDMFKDGTWPVFFLLESDSERQTVEAGSIIVKPNPAKESPLSFAQKALEAVESAITKLTAGTNSVVNINGQQYTKKDLSKLLDDRARLKAEVIREQQKAAGGINVNLETRFVSSSGISPINMFRG